MHAVANSSLHLASEGVSPLPLTEDPHASGAAEEIPTSRAMNAPTSSLGPRPSSSEPRPRHQDSAPQRRGSTPPLRPSPRERMRVHALLSARLEPDAEPAPCRPRGGTGISPGSLRKNRHARAPH